MRAFYTLFLLVGLFCPTCFGQNFSIEFQQESWENVLKRACEEKKQVFLDCYTTWCGPCKILEKTVFTQDSVAMFFNRNFVCVKMDMEKEGKELAGKFQIQAFPTLLFIDPCSGKVNHRMVGAGDAAWLIAGGKKALEGENSLAGLSKKFETGERNPEFVRNYLDVLADAGMRERRDSVMECWWRGLSDEELLTPLCWGCIERHIDAQTSPMSYCFGRFLDLHEEFYKIGEKRMVDLRIGVVIQNHISKYTRWKSGQGVPFDEAGRKQLADYLRGVEYERVPAWLAQLSTAAYVGRGDYRGMFKQVKKVLKKSTLGESEEGYYLMLFLPYLTSCDDKPLVKEAVEWLDVWCGQHADDAVMSSLKERLLKAL